MLRDKALRELYKELLVELYIKLYAELYIELPIELYIEFRVELLVELYPTTVPFQNYPVSPAYHHVSVTHWPPLSSHYLPLFRVYIDTLELDLQSSCSVNSTHCKSLQL